MGFSQKDARKIIRVLGVCLLMLFLTMPACVSASSSQKLIKVGYFEFAGYHAIDSKGIKSGYGYDVLQMMAQQNNWKYKYVGYKNSWADMQEMLKNGRIDMLTSAQKTSEREKIFAFSSKPIGTSSTIITVKSGNKKYVSGKYSTYNGMRVGMLRDSSRNSSFKEFAAKKNFTYKTVYYDDIDQMQKDLQNGKKVDAIVTSDLRQIENEWILNKFDTSNFYVIVRKNDKTLLKEVNEAIDNMDAEDPNWRNELKSNYYAENSGNSISFTSAEQKYINKAKSKGIVFTAIVNPDRYPYSYFSGGKAKGVMPDVFKEISKRTGLKFKIIETKDREEYYKRLKKGNIDVRIDTFNNYYNAEKTGYKLSDSYITTSISRITRKNSSDNIRTVAVLRYTDASSSYSSTIENAKKIKEDSIKDCVNAVLHGKADATFLYSYTAEKTINEYSSNRLTATIMPDYRAKFALGISTKDDPILLSIMNKAVGSVNSGYVQSMIEKNTQNQNEKTSIISLIYSHPLISLVLVLLIAGIIFMIFVLVYRQRNLMLIEEKNADLTKAIEEADKANRAKSEFLSSMSHDIRTPLNGIIGMTYLANEQDNPEKTKDYLAKIDISSKFLLDLVNDVLDMAKAESGSIKLNLEPFIADDFLDYLDSVIRPLFEEKHQNFIVDAEPVKEFIPMMDKLRTNQIFFNLLSNSSKYTPEGGTIYYRLREHLNEKGKLVLCAEVEDNGIGMSKEFQKNLVNPFTQENRNDSDNNRGTGLGLSIVKKLLDQMGGTIEVESEMGKGTKFTIQAEFDCIPANSTSGIKEIKHGSDYESLSGKHILICEDHPLNQEIVTALLEENGMIVEIADNGEMGIEKFKNSQTGYYDMILMDIRMPIMNGYVATKNIRRLERDDAATVPIIAMTADAFGDDIAKCLSAGMNGHISKPIDTEKMIEVMSNLIMKK